MTEGGGVGHQILGTQVQHENKNWTQSYLRFCKNEGSNRFKINEKEAQLDRKSRTKVYKMLKIFEIIHFGEKLDQL